MPKYIELEAKVLVASEGQMGERKERPVELIREYINSSFDSSEYNLSFPKPLTVKEFVAAACEASAKWYGDIYLVKDDNHEDAWHCLWRETEPRLVGEHYRGQLTRSLGIEDIADKRVSRGTLVESWGVERYFISLETTESEAPPAEQKEEA